jgi:hypothetical protein
MPLGTRDKLGLAWMALLLYPCAVSAQELADPSQPESIRALFDRKPREKKAQCSVSWSRDQDSGTFGVRAVYTVGLYQDRAQDDPDYFGPGFGPSRRADNGPHTSLSVVRVKPENPPGNAVYLVKTSNYPSLGDSFWVGKGRYTVDLVASDDLGRICRKKWHLAADPAFNISLEPGVVAGTSSEVLARQLARDPRPRLSRLTVLLDAAPRTLNFQSLPSALLPMDSDFLLEGLTEILLELPAASARLICFSLDQQTEIFRDEDFHLDSLRRVRDSLKRVSFATVDAHVGPQGRLAMLARLINEEIRGTPPDAVIFFGPQERFQDAIPEEDFAPHSGHPQFFYLRPRFWNSISSPYFGSRDGTIAKAMKSLGGKTIEFATDFLNRQTDLSHMVDRIRRVMLPQSN